MPHYRSWSFEDLVTAVHYRGLDVWNNRPTREVCIQMLEREDQKVAAASGEDQLQRLPGELRNLIYEESLHFKAYTCYPKILGTCKYVHQEAYGMLYHDNVIEVIIYVNRVEAHGQRCGLFNPTAADHTSCINLLVWPEFLRKVMKLRCVVVPTSAMLHPARVSQILYSLCSCVEGGNKLESFELDLTSFFTPWQPVWALHRPLSLPKVAYGICILGILSRIYVRTGGPNEITRQNAAIKNDPHSGNVLTEAETVWFVAWAYDATIGRFETPILRTAAETITNASQQQPEPTPRFARSLGEGFQYFNAEWETGVL